MTGLRATVWGPELAHVCYSILCCSQPRFPGKGEEKARELWEVWRSAYFLFHHFLKTAEKIRHFPACLFGDL